MKTVNEILQHSSSHFNTIHGEASVLDALALMKIENTSFVIVMDNGHYSGIMSERDYSQKIILAGRNSSETKVKEILSSDVPVINMNESTDRCKELMLTFKTQYLPVFDGFEFKGVITLPDLLHASVEENKEQTRANNNTGLQQYWI